MRFCYRSHVGGCAAESAIVRARSAGSADKAEIVYTQMHHHRIHARPNRWCHSAIDLVINTHQSTMSESDANLNGRVVCISALAVTTLCATLTWMLVSNMPRSSSIPFLLELWIVFGWVTGLYLSVSYMTVFALQPLTHRFIPPRLIRYFEVAHGLQLPVVVGGVGTWAFVKLLGYL